MPSSSQTPPSTYVVARPMAEEFVREGIVPGERTELIFNYSLTPLSTAHCSNGIALEAEDLELIIQAMAKIDHLKSFWLEGRDVAEPIDAH